MNKKNIVKTFMAMFLVVAQFSPIFAYRTRSVSKTAPKGQGDQMNAALAAPAENLSGLQDVSKNALAQQNQEAAPLDQQGQNTGEVAQNNQTTTSQNTVEGGVSGTSYVPPAHPSTPADQNLASTSQEGATGQVGGTEQKAEGGVVF